MVSHPFAELFLAYRNFLSNALPGTYEVSAFVRYKDQFHWELEAEIIVEPGSLVDRNPG